MKGVRAPEIVAIVPARGGSKGVPRKNIVPLAGQPLIAYTLQEAHRSRYIQRVVVTTDDEEIATVAREFGGEVPFLRPQELAEDRVPDLPVFKHCLEWLAQHEGYRPEFVAHLRPTAPLRRAAHIDQAIEMLLAHPEATAVRSVCSAGQHPLKMWRLEEGRLAPYVPEGVYGIQEAANMPRQALPQAYVQNGSVDIIRASTILEHGSMTGAVVLGMVMDEMESVNIDSPLDLLVAEVLLQRRQAAVTGRGKGNS